MKTTDWNKVERNLENSQYLYSKKNKYKSNNTKKVKELKYFTTDVEPSHAELKIILALTKFKVKYLREVSFKGFFTENKGHYRFDFYFPEKNLIIEYDGKEYHKDTTRDEIKNKFCKKNKIRLVRISSESYYNIEKSIRNILIL